MGMNNKQFVDTFSHHMKSTLAVKRPFQGHQISHKGVTLSLDILTLKYCNQLPAETLATFLCRLHIFGKVVRKAIVSDVK